MTISGLDAWQRAPEELHDDEVSAFLSVEYWRYALAKSDTEYSRSHSMYFHRKELLQSELASYPETVAASVSGSMRSARIC